MHSKTSTKLILKHVVKNKFRLVYVISLAFLFCFPTACRVQRPLNIGPNPGQKKIIAYFFGVHGFVDPDFIPARRLTHINYAFARIKNGELAESHEMDVAHFPMLNRLKKRNPDLKILISVGGWLGSGPFSDMALTTESRKKFITHAVSFVELHNLDGIDLDWEYPGLPGSSNTHRAEDKQNFTLLLQELRKDLDRLGEKKSKHYLLTIAAGAFQGYLDNIEMDKIHKLLDFINLMTYDFAGGWDTSTGHLSNLSVSSYHPSGVSAEKVVDMFLDAGVPKEKLILGVAFYGRGWKDVKADNNGLFQPGTHFSADLSYNALKRKYIDKNGFRRYWDESASAPYLWNEKTRHFITYEDRDSIKKKCRYVLKKGIGGVMFWEYHEDYKGRLLKTIYKTMGKLK
jgi:chitinase